MTTKEYSYTMKVLLKDGKILKINEYNQYRGCRKCMYSTEKAARKSMMKTFGLNEGYDGRRVVGWELTHNGVVIDEMK